MSFLTAASERSSSGSGVSGVSDASFSGVSSFSFSFCAALALLAIRLSWRRPVGGTSITKPSLPYAGGIERVLGGRRPLPAPLASRPVRARGVSSGPLKPRLSLHCNRKPKAQSRFRVPGQPLGFPSSQQSQRPYWPARGGAKTLDQRLSSIEQCQPGLHILQPGIVGLGRVLSQGLFGVPEFLN